MYRVGSDALGFSVGGNIGMQITSDHKVRIYQSDDTTDYLELFADDSRAHYHHSHTGTSGAYHRFITDSGYIELGPGNTGWGHIQTDRNKFYFNKQITVDSGVVSAYDEDLSLQRQHDNTNDRIVIQDDRVVTYVNGQEKIRAHDTYNYIPQKIYGGDGSAGAPMYNFWNDSNTGMFRYGTDQLGFATAGTTRLVVKNAGLNLINHSGLQWDDRRIITFKSNSNDRGKWNPWVSSIRNSGIQRHFDEEFEEGTNGVNLYNNAGGSNLVVSRITASADSLVPPNKTGKVIKVAYNGNGTTSPNYGGIYQIISSEENHTFVQIFQAKLPSGRYFVINENPQGTNNTSYWLTDNYGTGKWEWYARVSHCGDSGSFSSGGHISVAGGSDTAFNWYIASMTQYDVTESPYNYTSAGKGSSGQLLKADGDGTYSWQSQGGGSNLDADKLDGLQSSQFLRSDTSDSVGGDLDLGSGNVHIKKTAGNNTNNYAAVEVYSAGTADNQAAIAIQQQTSEGDTIIFADFEPHVEWGISAENSANRIDFTGGSSSPSLGTRTFKNNSGNDRTAYRKMSVRLDNGNVDIAGNLTVANGSSYAGDSTSGVLSTGSWIGDLGSNGWERVCGVQHDGGVFSIVEKNAQISTIVDGSYFAYEAGTNQGGGFYSSSDSSYANATGIVASGGTLYVKQADGSNASLFSTGDIICNSGYISGQGNDLQLRRTTNSDDRIVIEASETKIYGDAVERVRFGSYGIRNGYSGSEGGPVYSFKDDTDTGLWRAASNTLAVTTGGTNRMKFQSDGKIGVNGDTSDAFFRINSTSSQNGLKIIGGADRGASRYALHIDDNDANGRGSVVIDSASGTGLKINTQNNNWLMELVAVDGGGSPARACGVRMQSFEGRANGHYHFDEDYDHEWFSGNRYAGGMDTWQVGYRANSSDGNTPDYIDKARILVNGSGDLHADGDVIAYSSTIGSDIKLKKNVKDINYGLKDVLDIRAVEFDWKEKREGKHDIGFIAQEIEKIIPEVVNEVNTIGGGAKEGDTHKVVDYAKLTSVLIKAVQEQQQQINELKEKLNG